MPFVRVEKSRVGGSIPFHEPAIVMGAYLADGKAHKSRSVSFRMTRELIDQLGWELKDGRIGISVHEGTGADQGYLQLVVDEEYGYRASQGGGNNADKSHQGIGISVTIERFRHYVLNECPVPARVVNHIVDGDTLIVEVPDWLRFNPQSVPEVERVAKVEEPKRPLPRVNSVDNDEVEVRLNRRERRAIAQQVTRVLKR